MENRYLVLKIFGKDVTQYIKAMDMLCRQYGNAVQVNNYVAAVSAYSVCHKLIASYMAGEPPEYDLYDDVMRGEEFQMEYADDLSQIQTSARWYGKVRDYDFIVTYDFEIGECSGRYCG